MDNARVFSAAVEKRSREAGLFQLQLTLAQLSFHDSRPVRFLLRLHSSFESWGKLGLGHIDILMLPLSESNSSGNSHVSWTRHAHVLLKKYSDRWRQERLFRSADR